MGMSSCCLNPLPPSSTHDVTSLPTRTKLVPRKSEEIRSSWSNKCVVGLACSIIIGTQIGDYIALSNTKGGNSMASELTRLESQIPNNKYTRREVKWSDKRSCPPWHINSLETIVPEDLPRPSSHRKWDWVSHSSPTFTAPPLVKLPSKLSTIGCFSL